MTYTADIIHITDFRLPGPLPRRISKELRAESGAGYEVRLIQATSRLPGKAEGWRPEIRSTLSWRGVSPASSFSFQNAKIIVVHNPLVLLQASENYANVYAKEVLLIAAEDCIDNEGNLLYEPSVVERKVKILFGAEAGWAATFPTAHRALVTAGVERVAPDLWREIVRLPLSAPPRNDYVGERAQLGRHATQSARGRTIVSSDFFRSFPEQEPWDVFFLGSEGEQRARGAATRQSRNTLPSGSVPLEDFLASIDFWVYGEVHSIQEDGLEEVYAALAAGVVVILPETLEPIFGSAALYANGPIALAQTVSTYSRDLPRFKGQSLRGQRHIEASGPAMHTDRLSARGIGVAEGAPTEGLAPSTSKRTQQRVLFVTSNGAGMGHLTRLLSVANRLPEDNEAVFASLSLGVPIVAKYGFPYEYIASREAFNTTTEVWNRYSAERFALLLDDLRPDVLVFDGVWPYRGLREAFRGRRLRTIWMRRAMWREDSSTRPLTWADEFDEIIEPGEFAEEYDRGPTRRMETVGAAKVSPMTLLSHSEVLSKEEARAELGYGDDEQVVLVTLGAGNINDINALQHHVVTWFAQHAPHWRIVVTKPPIATKESHGDFETLQVYPLARYTKAFDLSVSAAGYNAFHEWMIGSLPTLWVPNLETRTDDQLARARWASDCGLGGILLSEDEDTVYGSLEVMTREENLREMKARLAQMDKSNGAETAAMLVGVDHA